MQHALLDIQLRGMIARIRFVIRVQDNRIPVDEGPPVALQDGYRDAVARAAPERVAEPQLDHRDKNHEGWRFVHGAGRCEHCGDDMPVFLMECETCQMRACRRCTLNRL